MKAYSEYFKFSSSLIIVLTLPFFSIIFKVKSWNRSLN